MSEVNKNPEELEDNQFILNNKDACFFCNNDEGLLECSACNLKFCNEMNGNESDIITHIKTSKHYTYKLKTKKNIYEEIKCCKCGENNIQLLLLYINGGNDESKSIDIFCKDHAPGGSEHIISYIKDEEKEINKNLIYKENNKKQKNTIKDYEKKMEREDLFKKFKDIGFRTYNNVKEKYGSKYEYYQVYKPLIVADYLYTKLLYESKYDYDIELLVNKKERYYFKIPKKFREINLYPGRVLGFKEVENDDECITFLGVITKMNYEGKDICCIWIMPINKHVTSLNGHTGKYKIREEFSCIPYTRMLEALDLFQNDESQDLFEGVVASYLTIRILGQYNNSDYIDSNYNNYNDYVDVEAEALKRLFGKDRKIETNIPNYGKLNSSQIETIGKVFHRVLNLIQGPPGTGKTFISSYIVYNIFKLRKDKSHKILLCSPSNSATDNMALSLIRLNNIIGGEMKICRVYSRSKEYLHLEDELFNISLHKKLMDKLGVNNTSDLYECPTEKMQKEIDKLMENMDIIISTCSTAWDVRIKSYEFPFVLIDEVTQCCEIESLIPIAHGCKHLTLIGDQKQLGPVVLHRQAEISGMKVSLFERMLKLYPDLHNLLKIQYRMHEEIVKFPNDYFYSGKIENDPSVKTLINEDFNSKFNLPNKDIPLLFVHIKGEEVLTKFKSKQNDQEAEIVALFVKKLNNLKIDLKQIGIITPYVAQKMLIQEKLEEVFDAEEIMNNLQISSVDGFQGREKDFIILSNVRSNPDGNIGFLSDYRRLNVSITRAKYGMIIIGDVNCLSTRSQIWADFIKYYDDKGLLVEPETKEKLDNYDKTIKYNINKLTKIKCKVENNNNKSNIFQEYVFSDYQINQNLNDDLLNNFECTENVYVQTNKRYYQKKNKKKYKNKKMKKNDYNY